MHFTPRFHPRYIRMKGEDEPGYNFSLSKIKSMLCTALWYAVFQTCAVTVWTRRAGQAVPLAARSSWGLIGVQRTGSGSRFTTEVTARQTVTVMTSRTQVKRRVACKQTKNKYLGEREDFWHFNRQNALNIPLIPFKLCLSVFELVLGVCFPESLASVLAWYLLIFNLSKRYEEWTCNSTRVILLWNYKSTY